MVDSAVAAAAAQGVNQEDVTTAIGAALAEGGSRSNGTPLRKRRGAYCPIGNGYSGSYPRPYPHGNAYAWLQLKPP